MSPNSESDSPSESLPGSPPVFDPLFAFWRYCEIGAFDRALVEAQNLAATFPDVAEIHAARGTALYKLGRVDEARAALQEALGLDPGNLAALYCLVAVSLDENRLGEAEYVARQLLSFAPEDATAHRTLACLHARRNDWSKCLESADRALALDPDDEKSREVRGAALRHLGREREGREEFEKALALAPDDPSLHESLGWQALWRDDYDGAALSFRDSLRLNPTSSSAREGMQAALRGRSPFYRWMFGLLRWFSERSRTFNTILLLGGVAAVVFASRIEAFLGLPASMSIKPLLYMIFLMPGFLRQFADLQLYFDPVARPLVSRASFVSAALTFLTALAGLSGYVGTIFLALFGFFAGTTLTISCLSTTSLVYGDRGKIVLSALCALMLLTQPTALFPFAYGGVPLLSPGGAQTYFLIWHYAFSAFALSTIGIYLFRVSSSKSNSNGYF